jgi:hypothetical protein
MCINILTQYACGHADIEYMNRHCQCALIVGPVREVKGKCGRVCGGGKREREVDAEAGAVKEKAVREERGVKNEGAVERRRWKRKLQVP